jgi:hypothetical protein
VASGKTVTDGHVEGTQCLLFQDQTYNVTHHQYWQEEEENWMYNTSHELERLEAEL